MQLSKYSQVAFRYAETYKNYFHVMTTLCTFLRSLISPNECLLLEGGRNWGHILKIKPFKIFDLKSCYNEGRLIMRKLFMACILLLLSNIYLLLRITKSRLYLPEISMTAKNPVSFHGLTLQIDTKIIEGSSRAVYVISLAPFYTLIAVALILFTLAFFRLKNK